MKNWNLKNVVQIKITGKNCLRYIQRLAKLQIEMWDIKKISRNEINLTIYEKDLETIYKHKTIYEIAILNYYGPIKAKQTIKKYEILLFCLLVGLVLLIFLTNIIFKVEVIHNDKKMRDLLITELEKYDLKPYKMVKTYEEIEQIKKRILEKYRDQIEWLEIEKNGTKYTVRVEERIKNKQTEKLPDRHIVAKENATILEIDAEQGDVLKKVGDYVKKGDIIISGNIDLYEETKAITSAKGVIYGETWYQVKTTVPKHYYKQTKTKNTKNWYYLKVGNKTINLFHKSYQNSIKKQQILLKHNILPIQLIKEKQQEVILQDEIYLKDEALEIAYQEVENKIKANLKEKEEILTIKKLKEEEKDSTIIVEFFVSVKKDITDYQLIEKTTTEEEKDV